MAPVSLVLAFIAGLLSILSPCVLPLLPVVLGTAVARHRLGPAALAAGLAVSFLVVGLFVATAGFSLGLDGDKFRLVGAILLIVVGAVLIVPRLQAMVATAASPCANWAGQHFGGSHQAGLSGQFGVGVLLGAVWAPCVGPTLGAASVLAAQGRDLLQVTLTMSAFAVGTAFPLLALGLLSREAMARSRGRLLATGRTGKTVLGLALALTGTMVATGLDRSLEAALLSITPEWITAIATRF